MKCNFDNVFNDKEQPIKIDQIIEGAVIAVSRSGFAPKEDVFPDYGHGYPIEVEDIVDNEMHFILHLRVVGSPLFYSFRIRATQNNGRHFGFNVQPYNSPYASN